MIRWLRSNWLLLAMLAGPIPVAGQDSNILLPVSDIEERLGFQSFEVRSMSTSRGLPGERTFAPTVRFEDGTMLWIKFAPAPRGGEAFNNRPQYEVAAYEVQKLFLDESEYVVPPTVARCFTFDFIEQVIDEVPNRDTIEDPVPTFDGWPMSLVVLQYWLWNVDVADRDDVRDRERLENDDAFARNAGNFNLLTYLIRHNDSNTGNFLMSTDPANPRIFSVDNGIAFSQLFSEESAQGTYWRQLRIDRFPATSIERLRKVTLDELRQTLGVVAQFELVSDGEFVAVDATENLDPGRGIRRTRTVLQLGLTATEIRNIHRRITRLIDQIDDGKYEVF